MTQWLFLRRHFGKAKRPRGETSTVCLTLNAGSIQAVDDIRATLLDRLNERHPASDLHTVTGFAFEFCDTIERSQSCNYLIAEERAFPDDALLQIRRKASLLGPLLPARTTGRSSSGRKWSHHDNEENDYE